MKIIKMNFLAFFKSSILIALFIVSSASVRTIDSNVYQFGEFKKKSYYSTIFNKTEIVELTNAENFYKKGKTSMNKADNYFRKAVGYNKIDQGQNDKNSKKSEKFEKKGLKEAESAYTNFFKAVDISFIIYSSSLNKIKNNNSKQHLKAEELSIEARTLYMNGTEVRQNKSNLKGKEKVDGLKKAFIEQLKALELQETAFMIFMNDPAIKYDSKTDKIIYLDRIDNNDKANDDNITDNDNIKKDDYNPEEDPNVYVSKEEIIIPKLNISSSDKQLLEDAHDKRGFADILMKEVDKDYIKIDNIRYEAAGIDDEYEKDLKIKMASGLEKVLFDKMIKASKLYFEADQLKYEVYLKYLPSARNSMGYSQGQKHENNAAAFHTEALKTYDKANFYSDNKSNLYIQLMNAVQTELSAIQEQENAFSTYFKFEVIPIQVADNKNITPGKTNDHGQNKVNELSFNYSGSFSYSKEAPEPAPLVHQEGIIFKIQIGLFKGLLSLGQYGKYSPISYDSFKNNPYRRFMLGEYRSYKAAEYVLNQVIKKGLTDPFIVAFEDGERKSVTYGISKLIRDEEFENKEAEEMNYLSNSQNDVTTKVKISHKIDESEITDISTIPGPLYSIQLGNFSIPKKIEDFNGLKPIMYEKNGSAYRYMTGIFSSYEEAKDGAKRASAKGFNEAFVIAYNNGHKVTLSDIETIMNSEESNMMQSKSDVVFFTVQIGVYSHKLNNEELQQFDKISKQYKIITTNIEGGLYVYSVGNYNNYKQASETKDTIKRMNLDGFVIAFKNGKKISANEAVELLKNK